MDTSSCQVTIRITARLSLANPLSSIVNLSARRVRDSITADRVTSALEASPLDPHRLTLEITESAMIGDPESAVSPLRSIAALGMHIAIDDFGTGCSAMAQVTGYLVQQITIDRSYVRGFDIDHGVTAIVNASVGLARSSGLLVVVEVVDTLAQGMALRAPGCDLAQGFLCSKPATMTDVDLLLYEVTRDANMAATRCMVPDMERLQ